MRQSYELHVADTVRDSAGAVVGILRKRCRSLRPDRCRAGGGRCRCACGGSRRNGLCLGSRVQLLPRAFELAHHEVAPPAEFGSLVPGVAFLQHIAAQEVLAVLQFPKLVALVP